MGRPKVERFVSEVLEIHRYLPDAEDYELASVFAHESVVSA